MSRVIPDTSFFICFLDDIKNPEPVIRIFNSNKFVLVVGKLVHEEIKKSGNYYKIKHILISAKSYDYTQFGEILRPFMSVEEISKGEHEVIATAYVLNFLGHDLIFILDDDDARTLVLKNLKEIADKMTGTVGFIRLCCCEHEVFNKDEAKSILTMIKNSKFRVKKEIVEKTIEDIEGC